LVDVLQSYLEGKGQSTTPSSQAPTKQNDRNPVQPVKAEPPKKEELKKQLEKKLE